MCNFFRLVLSDSWCSSLHLVWQFPSNVSSPKINIESDKSSSKAQKNIFLHLIAISPCFLSWWVAKLIKMIYYNNGILTTWKILITWLKTTKQNTDVCFPKLITHWSFAF